MTTGRRGCFSRILLEELHATQAWHPEVGQDMASYSPRVGGLQAGVPVEAVSDCVAAKFQNGLHPPGECRVVIYQEDLASARFEGSRYPWIARLCSD